MRFWDRVGFFGWGVVKVICGQEGLAATGFIWGSERRHCVMMIRAIEFAVKLVRLVDADRPQIVNRVEFTRH